MCADESEKLEGTLTVERGGKRWICSALTRRDYEDFEDWIAGERYARALKMLDLLALPPDHLAALCDPPAAAITTWMYSIKGAAKFIEMSLKHRHPKVGEADIGLFMDDFAFAVQLVTQISGTSVPQKKAAEAPEAAER